MALPTSDERFDFQRPLWNPVGNRIIAYAEQIQDDSLGKKQSQINAEVQEALGQSASAADIAAAQDELLPLIYAGL